MLHYSAHSVCLSQLHITELGVQRWQELAATVRLLADMMTWIALFSHTSTGPEYEVAIVLSHRTA